MAIEGRRATGGLMPGGWRAVGVACVVALTPGLAVQAGSGAAATSSANAGATITRSIPLEQVGHGDGLAFTRLSGRETLSFPVGDAADIRAIEIILPFEVESPFPANRRVSLIAHGGVIATRALGDAEKGVWRVAVPVSAVRNGNLTLDVEYAGAFVGDACIGAGVGGDRLAIGGATQVKVAYARGFGGDAMRALNHAPAPLAIALPDRSDERQVAAALLLAAARPSVFSDSRTNESGTDAIGAQWQRTQVRIVDTARPLRMMGGAVPTFELGGADPRRAAALFGGGAGMSGGALPLASAGLGAAGALSVAELAFGDLGADLATRHIAERGGWTIYLPANRLPPGRQLSGLVADLQLAHDGGNEPAIATIALNGRLLGSRTVHPGTRAHLSVDVPKGLATTTNRIDISVLRHERGGDCLTKPMRQVAQLLPSSRATLAGADDVADFHDLPAMMAGGVTLVLPGGPRDGQVAALSGLLSGMIAATTPLSVAFGSALPAKGAAIWVSDKAPPGTKATIPMDRRGARIRDADGATLVPAADMRALTLVQLLHDDVRPILWIRPGTDFADLANLRAGSELGYGDIALYGASEGGVSDRGPNDGQSSRVFAMHSGRERLVKVDYEGDFDLDAWLDANRIWMVLGAWLAISALFAWLLRQTYNARRDKLEHDASGGGEHDGGSRDER